MSAIKKDKTEKRINFVNPLSLAGISSKKTKILIIIMGFLFVIFFITAFVSTIKGDKTFTWWTLSCIAAMAMIGIAIFSKDGKK